MNQAQGGNANINGVGLFLAIAALAVSCFAAGIAFMVFVSGRDQLEASKELTRSEIKAVADEVYKAQGEIKDLQIRLDELKSNR